MYKAPLQLVIFYKHLFFLDKWDPVPLWCLIWSVLGNSNTLQTKPALLTAQQMYVYCKIFISVGFNKILW